MLNCLSLATYICDRVPQVLALVVRAPSGFNMQPYQCIVVTSDEAKQRLSKGMLGSNQQRSVAKNRLTSATEID